MRDAIETVANVRKALKGAKVSLYCGARNSLAHVVSGTLAIRIPSDRFHEGGTEAYMEVNAQANDLMYAENQGSAEHPTLSPRCLWNLYKVGGFYAARMPVKVSFGWGVEGYENPSRATHIAKLVANVVEEYNLTHVYPECEFSRIAAALEKLGATIDRNVTIDGEDAYTWNERRMQR